MVMVAVMMICSPVSDFSHVVYSSARGESLFTYNNILSMWVVIIIIIIIAIVIISCSCQLISTHYIWAVHLYSHNTNSMQKYRFSPYIWMTNTEWFHQVHHRDSLSKGPAPVHWPLWVQGENSHDIMLVQAIFASPISVQQYKDKNTKIQVVT